MERRHVNIETVAVSKRNAEVTSRNNSNKSNNTSGKIGNKETDDKKGEAAINAGVASDDVAH